MEITRSIQEMRAELEDLKISLDNLEMEVTYSTREHLIELGKYLGWNDTLSSRQMKEDTNIIVIVFDGVKFSTDIARIKYVYAQDSGKSYSLYTTYAGKNVEKVLYIDYQGNPIDDVILWKRE